MPNAILCRPYRAWFTLFLTQGVALCRNVSPFQGLVALLHNLRGCPLSPETVKYNSVGHRPT